jgi:hypothetical protein
MRNPFTRLRANLKETWIELMLVRAACGDDPAAWLAFILQKQQDVRALRAEKAALRMEAAELMASNEFWEKAARDLKALIEERRAAAGPVETGDTVDIAPGDGSPENPNPKGGTHA